MKKILIVGIVGSGKTTFARKLSTIMKYPIFELDQIAHDANDVDRSKRSNELQMRMILAIYQENPNWIFEGVYRKSHRQLYAMADTILYLNLPLKIRKRRIITRFIKQQLKVEQCHYKSDFKMLMLMFKWTRDYEEEGRGVFEKFLNSFDGKVLEFKTPREVNNFIITLNETLKVN